MGADGRADETAGRLGAGHDDVTGFRGQRSGSTKVKVIPRSMTLTSGYTDDVTMT